MPSNVMVLNFDLPQRVTHDNVESVLKQGLSCIADLSSGGVLSLNCAALGEFDSSALSLVLSLMRQAQNKAVQISFNDVPEKLVSLAKVYGMDELVIA